MRHHVGAPAESADGHAAADDLAEGGEIGFDPVQGLGAAERDAETGHDLVENQQAAVVVAAAAQGREKPGQRRHAVHVARYRLDDDSGNALAVLGEGLLDLRRVVEIQGQRMRREIRGHAGRGRHAEGQGAGARLDQQRIGVSVVTAFELHDGVTTREAACQTNGRHGRFGARAHHAHLLHRRHQRAQGIGHLGLDGRRRAESESPGRRLLHGPDDLGMRVAGDHRPPGAHVVDIAPAVGIDEVGALAALEEDRFAADRPEGPYRRVDAARYVLAGACKQRSRSIHACSSSVCGRNSRA